METVCGLTGIDFDRQDLFSYEQLYRMTLALTNDKEQVEQLFRRMVFNVIGLNNGDHIKNISFIHK
ncbi:HipA domain-containing protein [Capnocytophaga genosp. AHN8471]|uniref:HipA domain-containing protein n=1 Tax=Capnocytophaga genosp. AHN8471 TaxID=327574 RepID=A0ABS1YW81_9FLAO|nr:HipA domain-containing protein [Capnocytophaga genosp. AHN8471]MBM0662321.1 HipA domain-containing protein [Capnocytophaga genosp. AHN8471]